MYPFRSNQQSSSRSSSYTTNTQYNPKRRSKQGDWICVRCANYNYAFRDICNRCRIQTKYENQHYLEQMTKQNCGQNSFPSALFFALQPVKSQNQKQHQVQSVFKQNNGREKPIKYQLKNPLCQRNMNQDSTINKTNVWIHNLINQ